MNQLEIKIAKTLCKASSTNGVSDCPYCIKDQCQYIMWKTFTYEAKTVIELLKQENILKEQKLLPGLGG